jgi:hypothetical protein
VDLPDLERDAAEPEDFPTIERHGLAAAAQLAVEPDFPELEFGGDFDDGGTATRERAGGRAAGPSVDDEPREPSGAGDPAVRARVTELVSLAREAAERGDWLAAVEAVEAAASEDPAGLVAPVILHRHRDLLLRVYEGHIGEMTQVPLVAVPLHSIAAEHLDHRTGFLLSRIDGLLTYEDILDVAGMPRMEAYKILSALLRKGFIEVRGG